jgi:hypothetical protein
MRKQLRRVKRLAVLGALVGAVLALRRVKASRDAGQVIGPPATWPPLEPSEPPVGAVGALADEPEATPVAVRPAADAAPDTVERSDDPVAAAGDLATGGAGTGWIAPGDDGSCPTSHPVKANGNSGIYHLPGGQHYARTRAERCYVDTAAAEADGYRAAKSS